MTFAARCSCGTVVSKMKPLTSTKSSLFTASISTLANSEIGIRFFNHNRPLLSMYMYFSDCPMRKHKQPPLLSSKVMAVNLSSHFGPSCPEVKISIHQSGVCHAVISWLVVRQKKAARHSPYIKTITRTGGGNRPHGNFTPPHADGATVNAVKRSNRKYIVSIKR